MDIFTFLMIFIFAGIVPTSLGFFFYFIHQKQLKAIGEKVNDQQIIQLASENGGELSPVILAEATGLTLSQAKFKIDTLLQTGVLKNKKGESGQILSDKYFLFEAEKGNEQRNLNLPKSITSATKPSDAEVINLAAQNKGVISASLLCVKLNISIDQAKQKLEELRQKEIFITEVSENGGLIYRLIDGDLIV